VSNSFAAASNKTKVTGAATTRRKTEEPAAASAPLTAPAPSAAATRVEQGLPATQPLIWASLGGAAAVVCVLIGVLVARSQRREASLISRAIARQEYSIDG
jgi:hypothetical protein